MSLSDRCSVSHWAFARSISEVREIFREEFFEAGFVDGFHVGLLGGDHAFAKFGPDGFVHELHAFVLSAGDDVVEFLGCAFADDCGDSGCREHDFVDGGSARFVHALAEQLRHDAAE